MLRLVPFLVLIAFAACSPQKAVVAAPPETRAERLAAIERIAGECRVPRAMMQLVGEDQLRLQPARDEAYDKVECVLRRIDRLNLPPGQVTFVGIETNAITAVEADNAAAPEGNNAAPD